MRTHQMFGPSGRRSRPQAVVAVLLALGFAVIAPSAVSADTVVATIPAASNAGIQGTTMSPDGTRVYTVGPVAGTVSVIDTATKAVVDTITGLDGATGIAVSSDGTRLDVTSFSTGAVLVVDTATYAVIATIGVEDGPSGIAFSPDGTRAYVTHLTSSVVSVIDAVTNTVITTIAETRGQRALVVSPDGSRVYVAHYSGVNFDVSVIDTTTNTIITTIPVAAGLGRLQALAVSADGTLLYGTSTLADAVTVINLTTNTVVTIDVGADPAGIALTPDGTRAYVTNQLADTVSVIDTATNTTVSTIAVGDAPRSIVFTPDGRYAYVAGAGTVTVIAIDTFPAIVTTAVPGGLIDTGYATHIETTGSPAPELTVTGGTLPPGLALDPITGDINGDINGTPTATGTYTFTITASSTVSGIIATATQEYTLEIAAIAPGTPLDLAAGLNGDAVDLTWTPPTFDGGAPLTGYRVERSIDAGPFEELVADTGSTATTYIDSQIAPGSTYTYRVYALNTVGQSIASNEATVETPEAAPTTPPTTPSTTAPATAAPVSAPTVPPTPPPTAGSDPSIPVLPETGSDTSSQVLLAAGVLVLGALLIIGGRARTSPLRRPRR
jgi:LPXTG-motif cell wall-anchored protein